MFSPDNYIRGDNWVIIIDPHLGFNPGGYPSLADATTHWQWQTAACTRERYHCLARNIDIDDFIMKITKLMKLIRNGLPIYLTSWCPRFRPRGSWCAVRTLFVIGRCKISLFSKTKSWSVGIIRMRSEWDRTLSH